MNRVKFFLFYWMTPAVVIPARGGNGLLKPLDSGLRRNDEMRAGGNRNPSSTPASPFLDSGFRRAATGILGGLFQTPLYHLRPVGVPSRHIQDFLSINDGRGGDRVLPGTAKGLSG